MDDATLAVVSTLGGAVLGAAASSAGALVQYRTNHRSAWDPLRQAAYGSFLTSASECLSAISNLAVHKENCSYFGKSESALLDEYSAAHRRLTLERAQVALLAGPALTALCDLLKSAVDVLQGMEASGATEGSEKFRAQVAVVRDLRERFTREAARELGTHRR